MRPRLLGPCVLLGDAPVRKRIRGRVILLAIATLVTGYYILPSVAPLASLPSLFQRSGEPLIRIFQGNYAEVAFFGVAYAGYAAVEALIPQVTMSFAPFLMSLGPQDAADRVARWGERLLRWMGISAVLVVGGSGVMAEGLVVAG